jgi:hypothetical protein
VTLRLDDDERREWTLAAQASRKTLSEFVREKVTCQRSATAPTVPSRPPAAAEPHVHHIDDLGPDPLRGRDRALTV